MPGQFKKDAKYYKAFGKKTTTLSSFSYKDKVYSSDDYEGCDAYDNEAYILIKYNAKKKQWEVIQYMDA